jgi:predicted RNA-binding Zn-ribbon protein involved in translation (DUF1610 family)
MADWRVAHPRATFAEIEREVDRRLAGLRAKMLEDMALTSCAADVAGTPVGERPRCPDCGAEVVPRGQHTRTVLTDGGAAVELRRDYATCPSCGRGVFPPR